MQDLEKIERRGCIARGRVDKHIKITVWTCISARTRTEDGKRGHASGLQRGSDLPQPGENLLKCNVYDVAHGWIVAHRLRVGKSDGRSSRAVIVALGPRAAENPGAFRR